MSFPVTARWERYLHDDQVDALVRLAVTHYQFEAIHPFADGNGRTGRIINSLLLVSEGLLDEPTLYLSRFILERRSDYYRLLRAVTADEAWEPWILFILEGIESVSEWTIQRTRAITMLVDETDARIREQAPRIHSLELIDVMFSQPYCRIRDLVGAGVAKRQTASTYLKELRDLDLLDEVISGRDKVFINRALMRILES